MVIENILQHEIMQINREIIRKRVCIRELLEDPLIRDGNRKIPVNEECIARIASGCTLPLSDIFLPVTFFIPAGSYEGYITSSKDAEILNALGIELSKRGEKYWLAKYRIRKLERTCLGIVQSVILP